MLSHAELPMTYATVTDRLQMHLLRNKEAMIQYKHWFIASPEALPRTLITLLA